MKTTILVILALTFATSAQAKLSKQDRALIVEKIQSGDPSILEELDWKAAKEGSLIQQISVDIPNHAAPGSGKCQLDCAEARDACSSIGQ